MKSDIESVTPDVFWIGALDPDLVTFDVVMETKFGTTYNSYFINAGKKTIVDTVKAKFTESYLARIRQLMNPAEISYIVMNHTEPDHSGALGDLLSIAPDATVVGSGNAIRYLKDQLEGEFRYLIIKDGQTLDLGNKSLRFIGAPNLHWPDSIFTWLDGDHILFTCDVFGCHYCHPAMFDDRVGDFDDAFRYYFQVIMKPYSKFMLQGISRIRSLPVEIICPGHGPILRNNWRKYVDLSGQLAEEALHFPIPNRILIAYVSAYQNTSVIAGEIARGVRMAGDFEVDLCDLEKMELPVVEQKIIEAAGILVGCPTFNQNILMPVYQLLALINPIRDRNKPVASFGSYGWSGEAARILDSAMTNLRLKVVHEGLMIKFIPHGKMIAQCRDFGKFFGEQMTGTGGKAGLPAKNTKKGKNQF